jgi:large subunit ribosomal protein L30
MAGEKRITVKLVRSVHGRLPDHRACAHGLGLRRIGATAVLADTPEIRGMIHKIRYLLAVEGE